MGGVSRVTMTLEAAAVLLFVNATLEVLDK